MKRKSEENDTSEAVGATKIKLAEPQESNDAVKKESLYRPPTSEEITAFKETENLFKSSLFRMQISELLSEVQPKQKKQSELDDLLHSLNELLTSLPDGQEHSLSDTKLMLKKVKFPLPELPSPVKGKFHFVKPSVVKVVGSYLLGTIAKPNLNVDIVVQMPRECLHSKDYLNMHYHFKRAIFLAFLAKHLLKAKMFESINFVHSNGELFKPVLLLKPKGKIGQKFCIKLHISLPDGVFKPQRFSPDMNNIRLSWFRGQANSVKEQETVAGTPHYNASILFDMSFERNLHQLYKCSLACPAMKDAVILIKVWLRQRELDQGLGCFNGFLSSMLILHLLNERKINQHMSSYQILRIFLQFIGSSDWTTSGLKMKEDENVNSSNTPSVTSFHEAYDVVFIDSSGFLNLCSNMTSSQFYRLQHEARLSLEHLDSSHQDGFELLFMKQVSFKLKFDQFCLFKDISTLYPVTKRPDLERLLLDQGGDWTPVVTDWLTHLIKKGLGKRVKMVFPEPQIPMQWPVNKSPPQHSRDNVVIGLLLDPEHAQNVLDSGPAANSPEATEFRVFWGNKSELRRFQDGSILEAVVWPCSNMAEKRVVCGQIVRHLLQRHGSVEPTSLVYVASQLDSILKIQVKKSKNEVERNAQSTGTGDEEMLEIIKAYDSLCKQIRALDLPLNVNSLQGLSPIFRAAEVHPARAILRSKKLANQEQPDSKNDKNPQGIADNVELPSDLKAFQWCPAMEVSLQFETSGKWPDDLEAVQYIKAAFHLRLSEQLQTQWFLPAVATPDHVDVMKNGFSFRIKILHYREMALLEKDEKVVPDCAEFHQQKLRELQQNLIHLPVLTSTLHGLGQQFKAFSTTVRLAKRWIHSQLLSDHVTDECIELLVAHLFLAPAPFTPPISSLCGFQRFLQLLSAQDWKTTPIVVNLNNNLSAKEYQEISSRFLHSRDQLPLLFIATPSDKFNSVWTREKPTKMILDRMVVLAKSSLCVLRRQLFEDLSQDVDFKEIFRPPLDDYDVIIKLHCNLLSRHCEAIDCSNPRSVSKGQRLESALPVIDFDPVQCYLRELKESFGEVALFFHDINGGGTIGVLWKPTAFVPSSFKVLHAEWKMPVMNATSSTEKVKGIRHMVEPNQQAILSDFYTLGEGLVKNIEVIKSKTL